jgi:hypothetical protein
MHESVAQPGFLDQWANFSCVEKKPMGKMGKVFIDRPNIFGSTKY